MKKLIVILLLLAPFVSHGTELLTYPTPKPSLFSQIILAVKTCRIDFSCYFSPKLGATITTISSSTVVADFPTIYNTNNTNLNTDKIEATQATLSSLTSIGTITTGTWNASLITVPYGGTGWANIQANTVLYGNGTSRLATTTAGTNGQFLQLSGGVPTWATASIDLADNYSWSGTHAFSNTVTLNGSLVTNGANTLNATTTNAAKMVNTNTVNTFTAGDTITLSSNLPKPVSFATTTPNVFLSDGNVASTTNFMGFAVTSGAINTSVFVQTDGIVSGFSGLTAGAKYYVSDTVGVLGAANTAGSSQIYVGVAVSATQIYLDKGNSSWQYLSSASAAATVAVPPYTNYIIINATGAFAGTPADNTNGEVFLTRFGKTTGSVVAGREAGATDPSSGYSASWNTSTNVLSITVTDSALSGTVYFYR